MCKIGNNYLYGIQCIVMQDKRQNNAEREREGREGERDKEIDRYRYRQSFKRELVREME